MTTEPAEQTRRHPEHLARIGLATVIIAFVVISLPLVARGALLQDDYVYCMQSQALGLGDYLEVEIAENGATRPTRLLEISTIASLCSRVPYQFVILIPLALTIAVGFQLRGLLGDLGVTEPWPTLGGALWFLQPLGSEAALWPAAMHIPLGLLLALLSLRLFRRDRLAWGALLALGACLSVEQVIFALPLAVWAVTRSNTRRRATAAALAITIGVVAAYASWPGVNARTAVAFTERIRNVFVDPEFYVRFPATGLGLRSIPLAVAWALPLSLVVLAAGLLAGRAFGHRVLPRSRAPSTVGSNVWMMLGFAALLGALINIPLAATLPHEDSPRAFVPSWLAIAGIAAVLGARVRWRRPSLVGATAGVLAAGVFLSLAFSVSVRVRSAELADGALTWLAEELPDGGVVVLCDVPRTAVDPAPIGAFAIHDFLWTGAAVNAARYYTSPDADFEFHLGGAYLDSECPEVANADVVLSFDEFLDAGRGSEP